MRAHLMQAHIKATCAREEACNLHGRGPVQGADL
jgi:hypothetical protein